MAAPHRRWAAELLHFWFHKLSPRDWFAPSAAVDAELGRRFECGLAMLARRPASEFLDDPQTALAAVLWFDQVPRNLHRGSPAAVASGRLARAILRGALARGWDTALTPVQRQFLAMPLMHSEHISDQLQSLQSWMFARQHHEMIARFGRFPHRNPVLGRRSTPAEERAVASGYAW